MAALSALMVAIASLIQGARLSQDVSRCTGLVASINLPAQVSRLFIQSFFSWPGQWLCQFWQRGGTIVAGNIKKMRSRNQSDSKSLKKLCFHGEQPKGKI
jgi:hypothetical protein